MNEFELRMIHPCGPIVAELKMPDEIVKNLNKFADQTLDDTDALSKLDLSNSLAGRVRHEFKIDQQTLSENFEWFGEAVKGYMTYFYQKRPDAFGYNEWFINPTNSWINCSFPGDYNPTHHHQGECSIVGVGYLKVPDWEEEHALESDSGDGSISAGCLELFHGQAELLVSHQMRFVPKVGNFYLWPAGTLHAVWPYRTPGERRSVAINFNVRPTKENTRPVQEKTGP